MKTKTMFFFLIVLFVAIGSFAQVRGPSAISPGSDDGIAKVAQSCPTFSWTSVDWAKAYKVVVFETNGPNVLSYKEMSAISSPVLTKEIQGRALSWTPSSDERLSSKTRYVWYVQAVDIYGQGLWSKGRMFMVSAKLEFEKIEQSIRKGLQEKGVGEDIIESVFKDIRKGKEDAIAYGVSPQDGISDKKKVGIQDLEGELATNTFFGLSAGDSTTGDYNSFFGRSAGFTNSTGHRNTFVGFEAGYANIAGNRNTFFGGLAGRRNTSGDRNTYVGFYAGYWNTTGDENIFIGHEAGINNTNGTSNLFLGYKAGYENTWGGNNTFIGYEAGYNNTKNIADENPNSSFNTFIGYKVGRSNTSGNSNTFIGQLSGQNNTTGNNNVFLGQVAGSANDTGENNVFIGQAAGYSNQIGHNNVLVGRLAGYSNEGHNNVFLGEGSGFNNQIGNYNVFLGYNSGFNETGYSKLYIDNSDTSSPLIWGDFNNDILTVHGRLGIGTKSPAYQLELETNGENAILLLDRTDGATTGFSASGDKCAFGTLTNHPLWMVINGAFSAIFHTDGSLQMMNGAWCTAAGKWQDASSRELKENIQSLTVEEAKKALGGLEPIKFNYKADKEDESLGFIAEDVPELVASKDRKSMSTMDVVAVLTKVMQEQQEMIKKQQNVAQEQQKAIAELQRRIDELEQRK